MPHSVKERKQAIAAFCLRLKKIAESVEKDLAIESNDAYATEELEQLWESVFESIVIVFGTAIEKTDCKNSFVRKK